MCRCRSRAGASTGAVTVSGAAFLTSRSAPPTPPAFFARVNLNRGVRAPLWAIADGLFQIGHALVEGLQFVAKRPVLFFQRFVQAENPVIDRGSGFELLDSVEHGPNDRIVIDLTIALFIFRH